MNNATAILRSLILYAVCTALAITVGYLLTKPLSYSTFGVLGVVALVLSFPLLLRWHYPLLLFAWHTNITLFFIKGMPTVWLALVALSLGISVMHRALSKDMRFIRVPQITWPLICLIGIVIVTAELTGGFGLRAFGSEIYGGRKYIFLLVGILSYFALTAKRIPPSKVRLYVTLFFLGGLTLIIGDLFSAFPSSLQFIFWFFPPSIYTTGEFQFGETRLGGFTGAGLAILYWLMAIYGIRGIFLSRKLWRLFLFALSFVVIFLGGFRSAILEFGAIFALVFFLERMHRTKLFWVFLFAGTLMAATLVPLASHLPFTFQRSLAFLPLGLDPAAKQDAQTSLNWRIEMWKALLPQVPKHLLLGKGLAITPEDYEMMGWNSPFQTVDASQQGLALSYDYHNGPLSVVLPFGIWGVIAFLWFMISSLQVMYCNYRYGDPSLRTINTFLWANILFLFGSFMFLGGGFADDMMRFIGPLGLSIALNSGVCHAFKTKSQKPTNLQPSPAG
jgi:O-Antigen ligase